MGCGGKRNVAPVAIAPTPIGANVTPPDLQWCPTPVRPPHVPRFHSDTVLTEFIVDSTGRPERTPVKPRIVATSNELLNAAALQTVMGCRFLPARLRGQPIGVMVRVPVRFG